MEEEAVRVVGAVFEVKKQTHMLPLVLQVLEQRIGVQADEGDTPASQALPAPTADDAAKKEGAALYSNYSFPSCATLRTYCMTTVQYVLILGQPEQYITSWLGIGVVEWRRRLFGTVCFTWRVRST